MANEHVRLTTKRFVNAKVEENLKINAVAIERTRINIYTYVVKKFRTKKKLETCQGLGSLDISGSHRYGKVA